MALIPETQYPGQITGASANYPFGSAVNVTSPGSGDGTPLEQVWLNDWWGFGQGLLENANITPTGNAETVIASQYRDAIHIMAQAASRRGNIENDSGAPNTKMVMKSGIAWDSTHAYPIRLQSDLKKQIDNPWIAGDDAGGFPSGITLTLGTWYHMHLIAKADGTVDAGYDTSLTAVNLLADATDYIYFVRVGSILVDGSSNILKFFQFGNEFVWDAPFLDATSLTAAFADLSLATPVGINTEAKLSIGLNAGGAGITDILFKTKFQSGDFSAASAAANGFDRNNINIMTDTASTVEHKWITNAPFGYGVVTLGWKDITL